jgi:hypothetical protein
MLRLSTVLRPCKVEDALPASLCSAVQPEHRGKGWREEQNCGCVMQSNRLVDLHGERRENAVSFRQPCSSLAHKTIRLDWMDQQPWCCISSPEPTQNVWAILYMPSTVLAVIARSSYWQFMSLRKDIWMPSAVLVLGLASYHRGVIFDSKVLGRLSGYTCVRQDWQWTYNATLRRVLVTLAAMEKQCVSVSLP